MVFSHQKSSQFIFWFVWNAHVATARNSRIKGNVCDQLYSEVTCASSLFNAGVGSKLVRLKELGISNVSAILCRKCAVNNLGLKFIL